MGQPKSTIPATDVDNKSEILREQIDPFVTFCLNCLQSLSESLSPNFNEYGTRQTPHILHHKTHKSFRHSVEVLHCCTCDIFIYQRLVRGEGESQLSPRDMHDQGYPTMVGSISKHRPGRLALEFHFQKRYLVQGLTDAEGM